MADNLDDFFHDGTPSVEPAGGEPTRGTMPPPPPRSRRAMRRYSRRRRHRRTIIVIVVIVVVAVFLAGGYLGYRVLRGWSSSQATSASVLDDYPGPGSGDVQFVVETGQGVDTISQNLLKDDIIKSTAAFTSAVAANASTLYPGTYALKRQMAAVDVVTILSDQSKAGGFLQVKSGERVSDVVASASALSGIDKGEFTDIIDAGGSGILPSEANGSFEGWFEPGSYNVQSGKNASAIIKELVDARIAKLDSLGVPTGKERERILIISSIAESEVNSKEYYAKVTRVILNRLDKNMKLGMDTTVAYGAGVSASKLTTAMLADTSNPYNTRVHEGLPPTPISNPGDSAISAAMNPEDGDWLYFVTTNLKTGETKFASTEAEFWKIRDEYKQTNEDAN